MICILSQEFANVSSIVNKVIVGNTVQIGATEIYECCYQNTEFIILLTGYGKVNVGSSLAVAKERYNISAVICVGNCGSLNCNNVKICCLGISRCSYQYDVYFNQLGFNDFQVPNVGRSFYPASESMINYAIEACCNLRYGYSIGRFATADRFLANQNQANELYNRDRADFVDAECGDVGEFCCINNIDYVCIKGVSNYAGSNAVNEYYNCQSKMNEISSLVALEMINLVS